MSCISAQNSPVEYRKSYHGNIFIKNIFIDSELVIFHVTLYFSQFSCFSGNESK